MDHGDKKRKDGGEGRRGGIPVACQVVGPRTRSARDVGDADCRSCGWGFEETIIGGFILYHRAAMNAHMMDGRFQSR